MRKITDYYICAVHEKDGIIVKFKTCNAPLFSSTLGPAVTNAKTKPEVVKDVDAGEIIHTVYESGSDWEIGALVITEEVDGIKYVKTKSNGKKCDNLDNIDKY